MGQPVHILTIEVSAMSQDPQWWPEGADFKAALLAAFRRIRKEGAPMGWAYEEMDLLKCAVGLGLLKAAGEDKAWLSAQMKAMAVMSHILDGAKLGLPAPDMGEALAELEASPQREYTLRDLWLESKP